ncbi:MULTISPECIES: CAP domain-containing protein [unclassified Tolypothrix]|uniref:CAP domain-containing protein n=1 Tax=unclassified Tolypothrix TaxID=2649714 RepID=UPI0005EAB568|nr:MULTISPECIES: CAP domain-containing protein [unclassified Tolypothrix]BAY88376.1 allergen V5/Tpx-1 family protein [Microchaete diplosiphon NIES-3275]EKF02252.1 putative SCP extracelular protein [Tolypothrix sp. PCC 7601]MBE9081208.1 CAP domain-containing protein [Tolypothrix sp. LEGE 11397]UYD29062.1 CAP domain-containing protein [Tolypothrix sp. PCC 7712]UYD35024.1 CAP domain-containing protein [Tolypothrix sp. PCC 7601]
MLRQTAFGIALSTLVLASGLTTTPISGHSSPQKNPNNKPLSIASNQVVASNTVFKTTALEKSVFDQINRYRVSKGLSKLTLNANITRQARIHSQNMANGKVPFSHQGFEKRVTILPIIYKSAGENVAFNQGYSDPAGQAVIGWLNSPGHLKNIKGKYNLTGIGVAANQKGEVYLTQIFLQTN